MHDPFRDGVFRFIGSAVRLVWILLPLVARDVFQLVCFLFEEFVNFFLVLHDSLCDDLTVLNKRTLSRMPRRFTSGGRNVPAIASSLLCDSRAS